MKNNPNDSNLARKYSPESTSSQTNPNLSMSQLPNRPAIDMGKRRSESERERDASYLTLLFVLALAILVGIAYFGYEKMNPQGTAITVETPEATSNTNTGSTENNTPTATENGGNTTGTDNTSGATPPENGNQ